MLRGIDVAIVEILNAPPPQGIPVSNTSGMEYLFSSLKKKTNETAAR